jgi:Asp-tRNA(Asn)/Glu-tRNA(Gln) amidotransferase B subunit
MNTLTVISKNPFTGHELMALKQLHKQVVILNKDHKDRLFTVRPTGKYNLSRILSERTLNKMSDDLDSVKIKSEIFELNDNKKDVDSFK